MWLKRAEAPAAQSSRLLNFCSNEDNEARLPKTQSSLSDASLSI